MGETRDAERVAGLPDARTWRRSVVDVPVPGVGAVLGEQGGAKECRRKGDLRGEAAITARRRRHVAPSCGARTAGAGALLELAVRLEPPWSGQPCRSRVRAACPLRPPACAGLRPRYCSSDLERVLRGREEGLTLAVAEPERPADAAGDEERVGAALVEPGRRHRAESSSKRLGARRTRSASAKIASVSTVMRGAALEPVRAKISSSLRMMPLWMPTTPPWRTGWLLASIVG